MMRTPRLKRLVSGMTAIFLGLSLLLPPQTSSADTDPSRSTSATQKQDPESESDSDRLGPEVRRELYQKSRLSPWAAAGWTLLLPGLGNLYANQYLLAGLGFVSVTFSGSFLAYGYAVDNTAIQIIGYSFAGLAYGGGLTTSLIGVHRHNQNRRRSLGVEQPQARLRLPPDGPRPPETFMLNLNFSF